MAETFIRKGRYFLLLFPLYSYERKRELIDKEKPTTSATEYLSAQMFFNKMRFNISFDEFLKSELYVESVNASALPVSQWATLASCQ